MSGAVGSALRSEIKSALGAAGLSKVDDDILSRCVGLATNLDLSPKQIAECWEAYSINKSLTELNDHSFPSFRLALVKDSNNVEPLKETTAVGAVVSRPSLAGKRQGADSDSLPSVTPPAKRSTVTFDKTPVGSVGEGKLGTNRRISLSPAPPGVLADSRTANLPKYGERQGAGKVVVTFDPSKVGSSTSPMEATTAKPAPRCTITSNVFDTNVKKPYRHMFTTLEERAKALEEQMVDLGDTMIERFGLGKVDDEDNESGVAGLEAVGVPRQDKICCIGRICNEAHEGRINATSVLLEGSRLMSGGERVELDLSYLKATTTPYSLFPGQIVAVEGMNTSGRKMVAHRICEGVAHEPEKSTVKELLRYHHADEFQGGEPLKIVSVSGPFTTSDNLEYEPLLDLVNVVTAEKPDVVILSGPFVDMNHKALRSGQTTLKFQDGEEVLVPCEAFFANKIAGLLEDLFSSEEDLQTQFVLVPSLDDATAEWVFPQAPFTDRLSSGGKDVNIPGAEGIELGSLGLHHIETAGGRDSGGHRRVHCVSNPCTLKINELVIGVTATDILFHVCADETNAFLEPGSRLGRISQHMLQQRSYYPLFPPGPMVNLDLKHMNEWKMPCQPDLLIIPSKLTSFARTILGSTVVVNPGHLSRDTTGGTFAVMEVHPIDRETLEDAGGEDVEVPHKAGERTRVEIRRI